MTIQMQRSVLKSEPIFDISLFNCSLFSIVPRQTQVRICTIQVYKHTFLGAPFATYRQMLNIDLNRSQFYLYIVAILTPLMYRSRFRELYILNRYEVWIDRSNSYEPQRKTGLWPPGKKSVLEAILMSQIEAKPCVKIQSFLFSATVVR